MQVLSTLVTLVRECHCWIASGVVLVAISNCAFADDSTSKVREGMKHYAAAQFEEAGKSFAAATEALEKAKSDKAAVAAFDEACALHRKGDLDLARDRYLKAGLSQDKGVATSAHFNLGVIASEQAHRSAGENPESVPVDKRKEILGELSKSIDSYRHCLELQPQHVPARRNLELLRQWSKYYTDRWREVDLQKRRNETNLIQFLEFLVQTQLAFKETVGSFRSNTSPNRYAELKRLQEELRDEIPYLKDKIDSDLRPKQEAAQSTSSNSISTEANEELERGIALLSGWADEAGTKMVAAEKAMMKREASAAANQQQLAADQLDQIWDAVIPFHPLLAKELVDQTQIAREFTVPSSNDSATSDDPTTEASEETTNGKQTLDVKDSEWARILEKQKRVLRKARLLAPKAESELAQVESQPKPDAPLLETPSPETPSTGEAVNDSRQVGNDPATPGASKVDPEAIKAGYQKALELAPKAVVEMEAALKHIDKRDREHAATHAEEARRILQEIQDSQPKSPEQDQPDQNKDQEKDQNEKKEQNGQDSKDEQQKKEEEKKEDKQDEKKQNDEDKKDKDKKDKDKKAEQRQEPKVSKNRIEEALRRVREREQEKRERDRELKARVLGRVPVDKDW